MKQTIPVSMIALQQYEPGGKLFATEIQVPKPRKGEVLVKMAASPINQSDLSFLQGTNAHQPVYPVVPGIEGSGTVVASGGGILANFRMGKRVTCSSSEGQDGAWAEYMVTSAMRVIPLKTSINMEQGAMLIVNPMTALAFMNIASAGHHKAVVNNAASSVLGRMMIMLCAKQKLPLINIVRRKEQVELLKTAGATYILNSSDLDFEGQLKSLSKQLNATLFFDAVAGNETAKLVNASPNGSTIVIYSNLSEQAVNVEPRSLIQGDKIIGNFYLGNWTSKRNIFQTLKAARTVQKLVGTELRSAVQKRFLLEDANEAIQFYKENRTGGKVLLIADCEMQ